MHSVSAMAERLVMRGHEVHVFTTNSNLDQELDVPTDRYVDVEGVQVRYFRRSQPLKNLLPGVPYVSRAVGFLYCVDMRAELDRLAPALDVIHTHLPFCYPTYASAHAAFRYGVPFFYHQRGVLKPDHLRHRALKKKMYLKWVEMPILRRASGLIALTREEEAGYRALGLVGPCHVIPNGIDLHAARPRSAITPDVPGLRDDDLLILYLGRVHPFKGVNELLDAFSRIVSTTPRARLIIAGPDESSIEAQWRQNCSNETVAGKVHFVGMVEGERKLDLLHRADLFVLPSKGEGFSMAVLEALAASTPVLLSPSCDFPEVESAGAGRIVDPAPAALGLAMEEMLGMRGQLPAMGARGRRLVEVGYTWESIVDRTLAVYEAAARDRPPRIL